MSLSRMVMSLEYHRWMPLPAAVSRVSEAVSTFPDTWQSPTFAR